MKYQKKVTKGEKIKNIQIEFLRHKEWPDEKNHKNKKFGHLRIMPGRLGQIFILRSFWRSKRQKNGKWQKQYNSFWQFLATVLVTKDSNFAQGPISQLSTTLLF